MGRCVRDGRTSGGEAERAVLVAVREAMWARAGCERVAGAVGVAEVRMGRHGMNRFAERGVIGRTVIGWAEGNDGGWFGLTRPVRARGLSVPPRKDCCVLHVSRGLTNSEELCKFGVGEGRLSRESRGRGIWRGAEEKAPAVAWR